MLDILFIWLGLWVAAVAHELGHFAAGRLAGLRVLACGTGVGLPMAVARVCGTAFFVGVRRPFGGLTFTDSPTLNPPRWRTATMLLGGVAANVAVAAVLFGRFGWSPPDPVDHSLWLVGLMNAVQVLNLVPFSLTSGPFALATDGGQLWQLARGHRAEFRGVDAINAAAGFGPIANRLGLDHMMAGAHAGAAIVWAWLRVEERASAALAESLAVPGEPTQFRSYVTAAARATLAVCRGDRVAADAEYAAAAAVLDRDHDWEPLARVWLDRGWSAASLCDWPVADAAVRDLNGLPPSRPLPPFLRESADRLALVVRASTGRVEPGELRAAVDALATDPGVDPVSQWLGLEAFRAVAERADDPATAETAAHAGIHALWRLWKALAHPDDKAVVGKLLDRARFELEALVARRGGDVDAELARVTDMAFDGEQASGEAAADQRRVWQAVGLSVGGLFITAMLMISVAAHRLTPPGTPPPAWGIHAVIAALVATMISVFALFPAVGVLAARGMGQCRERRPGRLLLVLAAVAWPIGLATGLGIWAIAPIDPPGRPAAPRTSLPPAAVPGLDPEED